MRLQQISEALGVSIALFFEGPRKIPKVSDAASSYTAGGGDRIEVLQPFSKEEITLLKLFRKVRNKKVREGLLKQLRGVVEMENQE